MTKSALESKRIAELQSYVREGKTWKAYACLELPDLEALLRLSSERDEMAKALIEIALTSAGANHMQKVAERALNWRSLSKPQEGGER